MRIDIYKYQEKDFNPSALNIRMISRQFFPDTIVTIFHNTVVRHDYPFNSKKSENAGI